MSAAELAKQAEEQLKLHEKTARKLDAAKHQQSSTFQEKLNARLKKKEEKIKADAEAKEKGNLKSSGAIQIEAPLGSVSLALLTVKNVASFWESLDEESALKALEDIHDLVVKDFKTYNIYMAKEEIGRFLLVAEKLEDLINCVMKVQASFNDNKWSDAVMKIPGCKKSISESAYVHRNDIDCKLVRPADTNNNDAKPLFSGPRVQIGIHSGDVSTKKDGSQTTYSGINVLKVESIGNFTQAGQVLISDSSWKSVDTTKLDAHGVAEPGTYKLDGFSAGCKVIEVLPESLKDRSKFFGSVCAHCNEVIKPNEQFFKALDCIWHTNHFRCFVCNADLGGSYVACEGSPYCKNCYLNKNAPKCKNCSNPITGAYINALGGYWHTDCFACKVSGVKALMENVAFYRKMVLSKDVDVKIQRCLKKPSGDVQIYENEGLPYCGDCYKQMIA